MTGRKERKRAERKMAEGKEREPVMERKRRLEWFAFYDYAAIQAHLEDMAWKGWLIERLGNHIWSYRRIEPKRLHIAVTYFPDASEFDPEPTEGQRVMEEYCARDGWKRIAQWGSMQIFCNEEDCPVPIETDVVTQVETIHRSMRRNLLPPQLLLALVGIFQMVFMGWQLYENPVEFLSASSSIFLFPMWFLVTGMAFCEIVFYFYWYRQAREAAWNGRSLEIKTRRRASAVLLGISLFLVAMAFGSSPFGFYTLLFGAGIPAVAILTMKGAMAWMKRRGISRSTNRVLSFGVTALAVFAAIGVMTVVIIRFGLPDGRNPVGTYGYDGWTFKIYDDPMPLRLEELTDLTEYEDCIWSYERERDETFLLSHTEYRQRAVLRQEKNAPSLDYTVTEVKVPVLFDFCKNSLLKKHQDEVFEKSGEIFRDSYVPADASAWGADEAYQLEWSSGLLNHYLVCWENQIVEIRFDWEPTREQMAAVGQKLGFQ
ncbi:MAG: DUF2812 domain-containing protein [Lachnospiraceae bacterium]|nr:DUF2812 domain-containing protein [Lachnospiraceae bacterium]